MSVTAVSPKGHDTPARRVIARLRHLGPVLALLGLCLAFSVAEPNFATVANLQAVLEASAIPLIVAVGATFVIVMGSIDLSVEGIVGVACVLVAILVRNNENANDFGMLGILAVVAVGALLGLLNGALNVYLRLPSLMATIGTWFLGLGLSYIIFPPHQPNILYTPLTNLMIDRAFGFSILFYIAIAIMVLAHLFFRFVPLGRVLYAIGGDEPTAVAAGVPVRQGRLAAFVIAGTLSAIAGIFVAGQLQNGYPNGGRDMLFPAIGATVIGGTLLSGGRGGPFHSAIGVLILAVLQNGMIQLGMEVYTRNIVVGITIVAAVAASNWHFRQKLRVVK